MDDYKKLNLCPTDVQAMMKGVYQSGTIIKLRNGFRMVCLDGEVWEIVSCDSVYVYTLNPTNAVCDTEIVRFVTSATAKKCGNGGAGQVEASSDD